MYAAGRLTLSCKTLKHSQMETINHPQTYSSVENMTYCDGITVYRMLFIHKIHTHEYLSSIPDQGTLSVLLLQCCWSVGPLAPCGNGPSLTCQAC